MICLIGRVQVVVAWLVVASGVVAGSAAADPKPVTLHDAVAGVAVIGGLSLATAVTRVVTPGLTALIANHRTSS